MRLDRPLCPAPVPSLRPWAGTRLGPGIGELWVAGPGSTIVLADGSPITLDDLAVRAGADLVGSAGLALYGLRFPLLAKLIDAAEWLSLQVHPDDALAQRLYGEAAVGKDEAWVVIAVTAGARLVTGPRADLDPEAVRSAVASGTMDLEACSSVEPAPGDTFNVPSGAVHAIGAGTFVYEVEQPSDLTFRISDWGRPPTQGRHLHLAEAEQAVRPSAQAAPVGQAWRLDGGVLDAPRLRLELVTAGESARRPAGRSPEIVTAVNGAVTLAGPGWTETLAALETAVVPAAVPSYSVVATGDAVAIVGSLPG